jgi:ribosomal protein S18 acetylase RimI-like enzyme
MTLYIRECVADDLLALCALSRKTYDETFRQMNSEATMEAYLAQSFDIHKMRGELTNHNSAFYFLYADKELAGYLKLNEADAQTDLHETQALEIERIYVDSAFQGKGLGQILMNKALALAAMKEKLFAWLGVWEKNEKAIAFYKKNGFYEIGKHSFVMGEEIQSDFVMRKDLK